MARPLALACVVLPLALILGGCGAVGAPQPTATHRTEAQICTDIGNAVKRFYAIASPGSTVTALDVTDLPTPNGVHIPRPDCSFRMRPDPELVPGDVWTLENFYLSPAPGFSKVLDGRLVKAGYKQTAETHDYSLFANKVTYSASILKFSGTDDQAYSKAAQGPVLDFSVGQR